MDTNQNQPTKEQLNQALNEMRKKTQHLTSRSENSVLFLRLLSKVDTLLSEHKVEESSIFKIKQELINWYSKEVWE